MTIPETCDNSPNNEASTVMYLAGSSSVLHKSRRVARLLESRFSCQVFIPQELVPANLKELERPQAIFDLCKHLMDKADIIIVNTENYGRDTASEIGYCNATGKTVIGFAENGRCKDDFMVSGFLHYLASEEEELVRLVAEQIGITLRPSEVGSGP